MLKISAPCKDVIRVCLCCCPIPTFPTRCKKMTIKQRKLIQLPTDVIHSNVLARVVPIHKMVPNLTIPTIGQYLYLFYFRQSGFREHHSCPTALIKIIDDWLSAINENKIAGSLFLVFSKAFDLVDHSLLIHKHHT